MGPQEAVVAGSAAFVDALLPAFTLRLGGAPRVADSPTLASALCQEGARLLVYEHGGREWLSLGADARAVGGSDLVVVAALPPEHAADVAQISAVASAVVAWRGDPQPVLDATSRVLAARDAPAPARRPSPVLTPQPMRPAVTPMRPLPVPPPRPVMTPQARPAVTPSPTAAVAAAIRPALTPSPTAAVAAAVRPALTPSRAVAPPADPFAGIFEQVGPAAPVAPAAAVPPPSMPAAEAVWPATVLAAADGLAIVRAAVSGLWPEERLRATTERVVAGLATAEKAAALGQKLPFDPNPVRRAVGLRWQVAAALDTLPAQGSPVDQPAVQDILGGIDEVLAELKVLSDDAGPEAQRALEGIRHALVKEAIDLTEALQSVASPQLVEEVTSSRKARRAEPTPGTRVVFTQPAGDPERRSAPWGLIVVLVLAVAAGAGYHGYRYVNRPRPAPSVVSGAPSGTIGTVAPQGKVVVAPAGKKLDAKELESFKNLEKAKGNEVREVVPGTFVVTPAGAAPARAPGKKSEPAQGATP